MNIEKLLRSLAPSVLDLAEPDHAATQIAAKFGMPNPQFLANILSAIEVYTTMHKDVSREGYAELAKLRKVRAQVENVVNAARALWALEGQGTLGGVLVSLNDDRSIFQTADVHNAVSALLLFEVGEVSNPADACLEGFVISLGEYWFDCFDRIPEGQFEEAPDGIKPIAGTAADYVVEALSATSWSFDTSRVATAFAVMQENLWSRFGDASEARSIN
ncbi:MAG: hypothetical protein EON59_04380 [Alphaproteobacteria bacterium]|nr:MAG: hypothetical protein EON59_04380 [Alphaproteobacteria bacterium]